MNKLLVRMSDNKPTRTYINGHHIPIRSKLRRQLQHIFFRHILELTAALPLQLVYILAHKHRTTSPATTQVSIYPIHPQIITYCTPKSPVENTSIRFRAKQANISTDHLPKPRTAVNFSTSSSSLAFNNIRALSSPLANFSDNPCMYSALRWDRPAVRSVLISILMISSGVGKKLGLVPSSSLLFVLNNATNLSLIDFAAAPDTCCPMILLTRLRNGSISSARPSGVNNGQGCSRMSDSRRGSVAIRCAAAFSRSVPVVAVGRGRPVLLGDASASVPGGYATSDEPWGVRSVALVWCGSTGRSSGGGVVLLLEV